MNPSGTGSSVSGLFGGVWTTAVISRASRPS
jgi:hypothetical protein